jgi:hypothetical protein
MTTKATPKRIQLINMLPPLIAIFLVVACDRKFHGGSIVVGRHIWRLERVDTFFRESKYRPRAVWYNTHDRLRYVDFQHEFPYPHSIGAKIYNFDKK